MNHDMEHKVDLKETRWAGVFAKQALMQSKGQWTMPKLGRALFLVSLVAILLGVASTARGTDTILYSFGGSKYTGTVPKGGLIEDGNGNFYGTTCGGGYDLNGNFGNGVVYKLSPPSGGVTTWTETVLYTFEGDDQSDGYCPVGRLVRDGDGNLYGVTEYGGGYSAYGTVFELSPGGTETVLYRFSGGADGQNPVGGLVRDASGNLFGVTTYGGDPDLDIGMVFELSFTGGVWTETVLHTFTGYDYNTGIDDGENPDGGLVRDGSGNLYGAAGSAVFELSLAGGGYTYGILYTFNNSRDIYGHLLIDSKGNLFGTRWNGGANFAGSVFEVSPPATPGGDWTEATLYSFGGTSNDGRDPRAGLIMDGSGNLYGTTERGGGNNCEFTNDCGTVFELAPPSGDVTTWAETVLHSFTGPKTDGWSPRAGLMADTSGKLYGTAAYGGAYDSEGAEGGTVFEVSPATSAPTVKLSPTSLDFGQVPVNTESAAQSVTVTNTGAADLIINAGAVTLGGADPSDFTITADSCSGQTVTPNNTCSVSVAFWPNAAGSETASLSFADNASDSPQSVALSGTGLTPQQVIQNIINAVNTLYSEGVINGGQDNSLVKQLQHAISLACGGNINGAIGNLESFISEVEDLEGSGTLTLSEATALIDAANSAIASLQAATGPLTCS